MKKVYVVSVLLSCIVLASTSSLAQESVPGGSCSSAEDKNTGKCRAVTNPDGTVSYYCVKSIASDGCPDCVIF